MCAKPVTSVGAVERLELVELAAIDEARDDLAHVVGLARIGRHDAVELAGVVARRARRAQRERAAASRG